MTKPIILIAAGGTGGHMFPAKAFADEAAAHGFDVVLICDSRGKKYIDGFASVDNLILPVTNSEEGGMLGKIKGAINLIKAIFITMPFMKKHSPVAVIGFGGYPTVPALLLAKCPIIIHEQNGVLGRVNRFFQDKASKICSGFASLEGLKDKSKQSFVGNPVRKELVAVGLEPFPEIEQNGTIRVLITGGSQGARALGQAFPMVFAQLPESLRQRLYISHQVREEQCDEARHTYLDAGIECEVWPFFRDMASRLKNAHLIIGRSGASTVSETAVIGRAAIFVPLPYAMNDHQTYNAKAMVETGGADMFRESELDINRLTEHLEMRLMNPEKLKSRGEKIKTAAKPDAAKEMVQIIKNIIGVKNA